MKKICFMLAFLLMGCSTQVKEMNMEETSSKVIDQFYEDMILLNEDEMVAYFNLDLDKQSCVAYISSNQINRELVMCKGEGIDEVYTNHLADVKRSTKVYFPEQLTMLDQAFHEQIEDAWVLVIHEEQDKIVEFMKES